MAIFQRKLKLLTASVLAVSFLLIFAATRAEAAANDSSIGLKKDQGSGYFTLTVKDPDGILEFSLSPVGSSRYGGGLSGCPRTFSNNNVAFGDPSNFTPVMPAYIIDCNNNTTELEIPPPVDGVTRGRAVAKEEPPPPPPPPKEATTDGIRSAEDILFPVPELGNCQNETECRSYCDNAGNARECLAFAKKYNLISEEELKEASDKFLNVRNGPGGCSSWSSCENYCSDVTNLDECIAFADETGYYTPEKLAEARKFQELVKAGVPFPGGCKDRNECEVYCGVADNMGECLDFAEKSGFMPQEEIAEARKFMNLMRQGKSPGGCNSKEQCENYCAEEGNIEECVAFAEEAGVMTAEEAEMVRKTGGKGPGGCRSKAQCDTYCEENSEECFNFAKEHGLISEADLAKMTEGMKRFRDELDKMPPEAVACMKDAAGEDNFNKMVAGEPVFDRSLEEKMKSCFEEVTAQFSQQLGDLPPEAAECIGDAIGEEGLQKLQSGGPDENLDFGSLENCFKDLKSSFGGGSNFGGGGFSGPGGCTNTEECSAFCMKNPEECKGFGPPPGGGGGSDAVPSSVSSDKPLPSSQSSTSEPPSDGANYSSVIYDPGSPYHPDNLPALPDSGTYAFKAPTKTESCVPSSFGLVSWWNGDKEGGVYTSKITAWDLNKKTNGNMFSQSPVSGKIGMAFGSPVVMGNPASLNFGTGPFSLEAWFKWEGGGNVNNIIRKSTAFTGAGYWLRINQSTELLEFFVGDTSDAPGKPRGLIETPVSAGAWHHVIATRNSSGVMKLYVDGVEKGAAEAPGAVTTSGGTFAIGGWDMRGDGDVTERFSGLVDEVSVYDKALSTAEVGSIFNLGSEGKCARQVAYPSSSTEYKREYVTQQQAYQFYLLQQSKSTSCAVDEYWNGSYCSSRPQAHCGENEYWDGTSCLLRPSASPSSSGSTESITIPAGESGGYSGPGGCKSTEECTAYCIQNYTDPACATFNTGGFIVPKEPSFTAKDPWYRGTNLDATSDPFVAGLFFLLQGLSGY
ncbi:MAG: LamG domain-containing protein [Parcubacteria group bacterium]|nr:LamG domain-containing protein [Parcubacteria group bacterium]